MRIAEARALVHRDGESNDGAVRIWKVSALLDALDGKEHPTQAAQLAAVTHHQDSVNCVRYLASASDDHTVLLWMRARKRMGFQDGKESWLLYRRLLGHNSNVKDLAWHPDGRSLASCSMDGTCIIWSLEDGENETRPAHTINPQCGWVVGVAWDPTGEFLATALEGDDENSRSLRVWNANRDYSLVWSENRMLRGTAETALWRRMSWAPDGAALCVPNATPPNNSFPVARTVLRDPQWNADLSLVGHELPTVVGRFHPRLFTPANEAPEQAREEDACPSSLLCLGAYDGSLSFWVSGRERAVVALHSALPGTVTDVAWLHGQAVLIAVSESGDAVAVRADDTVGPPSSSELVARRLGQLYGAYAGTMATSSIAVAQVMQGERSEEGSGVREGGAIAPAARQTEAEDPSAPCPSSASATAPAPSAQQLDVRSLQQESRAKGRRRILPCLVASTSSADVERPAADDEFGHEEEEEEEVEAGAMAMAAQHGGPRLPLRPRMPTNGRDTGLHSPQRAAGRGEGAATPDRALRNAASPGGRSMRTGISATAVTPLRDARQLSGGAGSHRADAAARSMRACFKAARGTHRIATAVASSLVPSSKSSLANSFFVPPPIPFSRFALPVLAEDDLRRPLPLRRVDVGLTVLAHAKGATASRTTAGQGDVERSVRAARSNSVGLGVLTWRMKPDTGNAGHLETAVSWWEEGAKRWSTTVCGRVLLGVASTHFAAVGTEAGVLHVFSPHGRPLTPPIALGGTPAFVDARWCKREEGSGSGEGPMLLVGTVHGQVRVIDVGRRRKVTWCDVAAPARTMLLAFMGRSLYALEMASAHGPTLDTAPETLRRAMRASRHIASKAETTGLVGRGRHPPPFSSTPAVTSAAAARVRARRRRKLGPSGDKESGAPTSEASSQDEADGMDEEDEEGEEEEGEGEGTEDDGGEEGDEGDGADKEGAGDATPADDGQQGGGSGVDKPAKRSRAGGSGGTPSAASAAPRKRARAASGAGTPRAGDARREEEGEEGPSRRRRARRGTEAEEGAAAAGADPDLAVPLEDAEVSTSPSGTEVEESDGADGSGSRVRRGRDAASLAGRARRSAQIVRRAQAHLPPVHVVSLFLSRRAGPVVVLRRGSQHEGGAVASTGDDEETRQRDRILLGKLAERLSNLLDDEEEGEGGTGGAAAAAPTGARAAATSVLAESGGELSGLAERAHACAFAWDAGMEEWQLILDGGGVLASTASATAGRASSGSGEGGWGDLRAVHHEVGTLQQRGLADPGPRAIGGGMAKRRKRDAEAAASGAVVRRALGDDEGEAVLVVRLAEHYARTDQVGALSELVEDLVQRRARRTARDAIRSAAQHGRSAEMQRKVEVLSNLYLAAEEEEDKRAP